MPRQIRKIKYHPAADFSKPSIILKSAYINILQDMRKAIRKSNLPTSAQELIKTAHFCEIKLKNILERLKKEPNLLEKYKPLSQPLTELFQSCTHFPEFPERSSFEKLIDTSIGKIRRIRQPSRTFFELIKSLNDLFKAQNNLYHTMKALRKTCNSLQKTLTSVKTPIPLTDSLNELLPSLRIYIDEILKFTKPSKDFNAILRNANKLKHISGQYEKGQI